MSLKYTRAVSKAQGLTARAKNVLRVLADRADNHGRCFPSHEQLAIDTEMSQRTIVRAMNELRASGWITCERRNRKDGSRCTDLITVRTLAEAAKALEPHPELRLFRVVELPSVPQSKVPTCHLGQSAKLAQQDNQPIKKEFNQPPLEVGKPRASQAGRRSPLDSGGGPTETQHEMAERLRRFAESLPDPPPRSRAAA